MHYAIKNDGKTLEKLIQAGAKKDAYSEFGNIKPDFIYAVDVKAYHCMEWF